jgi:hypothetical protein
VPERYDVIGLSDRCSSSMIGFKPHEIRRVISMDGKAGPFAATTG